LLYKKFSSFNGGVETLTDLQLGWETKKIDKKI
jgi:hypothetical protein